MRVYNKSARMYQHGEYALKPKCNIEVPEKVAKLWLATGDVVEYADPKEAKELADENAKLKAELEKIKNQPKEEAKKEVKAKSNKKK